MKWLLLLTILSIELYANCEGRPQDDLNQESYRNIWPITKIPTSKNEIAAIKEAYYNTTVRLLNKFKTVYKEMLQHIEDKLENLKKRIEEAKDKIGPVTSEITLKNQVQEHTTSQKPLTPQEYLDTKILSNYDTFTEEAPVKESLLEDDDDDEYGDFLPQGKLEPLES